MMIFLKRLLNLFERPFPYDEWKIYFQNSIIISIFITVFLIIFEPFGINTLKSNKLLICLGFGSMTFLSTIIYDLLVYRLLKLKGSTEKWTFGKWIIHTLVIMLLISLSNFLFARIIIIGFIDWRLFPIMVYGTFMIGILPVVIIGFYTLFNQERKFKEVANGINISKKNNKNATAIENNFIFEIPINQIKYVEALQNYIKIAYFTNLGEFKVQTERMTLKEFLVQTTGSSIVKCHRSFLVNKDAIVYASGNAQGLLLTLSECGQVIPVSRTFVAQFR